MPGLAADGFKTSGLALASRYTADMNRVIEAYNARPDNNTLVLFFVDAADGDKLGFMPLTGSYGFIFKLGGNVELLAHELAHGAFNLRHTFSSKNFWRENGPAPVFPERSTPNLLDYAGGTELWKYQWDLIHDPQTILFAALDEEEGAYRIKACLKYYERPFSQLLKQNISINQRSYLLPFYTSENCNEYRTPIEYQYAVDNNGWKEGDQAFDDYGNKVLYPARIVVNSPMTIERIQQTGKGTIKSYFATYSDITFNEDYLSWSEYYDAVEKWIEDKWVNENWSRNTEVGLIVRQKVDELAKAIMYGGDLNPQKVLNIDNNKVYEISYDDEFNSIYFNHEEATWFLWGYVSNRCFNFASFTSNAFDGALAFGANFLDRVLYNPTYEGTIEIAPWKVKAMMEGWRYSLYNRVLTSKNYIDIPMQTPYLLDLSNTPEGVGLEDVIDVTVNIYTAGSGTIGKKAITKLSTKMLTAAVLSWNAQILIGIISGQSYEEAVSNVEFEPIMWDAMSSIIQNENEALALDCIKATVDNIQKSKEYNLTGVGKSILKGCMLETTKNYLLKYLFESKSGPYSSLLKAALKNKTMKDIRQLLTLNFDLKTSEIDDILSFIPIQFIDSATGKINIP